MTYTADKLPRGRPTSYLEEYVEQAFDYADGGWMELGDAIPTLDRLAILLGTNVSTMSDWANKHDDFSSALERVKTQQKLALMNGSLNGEYNAQIAKMLFSANHGMSEKTEQHMTSDGSLAPTHVVLQGVAAHHEDDEPEIGIH
jgi:hypothetical protein